MLSLVWTSLASSKHAARCRHLLDNFETNWLGARRDLHATCTAQRINSRFTQLPQDRELRPEW